MNTQIIEDDIAIRNNVLMQHPFFKYTYEATKHFKANLKYKLFSRYEPILIDSHNVTKGQFNEIYNYEYVFVGLSIHFEDVFIKKLKNGNIFNDLFICGNVEQFFIKWIYKEDFLEKLNFDNVMLNNDLSKFYPVFTKESDKYRYFNI